MTQSFKLLSSLSLLSFLALADALVACDGSSEPSSSSSGDGSGGGSDGGSAEPCSSEGVGAIEVVITGLPDGVAAKVTIAAASGASSEATTTTTLTDRPAGTYTASAARVAKSDPIVRTLYEPTVSTSSFCLASTATQTVTVAYSEVGPSHKLWMGNTNNASGQLIAFAGTDLGATGLPVAKVAMKGAPGQGAAAGKSLAFDKDGNLWALGATTGDAALLRFAAGTIGASGEKVPDRKINPDFGGCSPALTSIAFDSSGALWGAVTCAHKVVRISPDKLAASSDYAPAAEDFATGSTAPHGLAFDKAGNMWVSGETTLRRYRAASLVTGQAHVPDVELKAKAANDALLPPDALAFDKDDNLWVSSFGANAIYKLTPADLTPAGPTKDLVPSVKITVPVDAIVYSLAFDESGGLWLTYSQGKVARLGPEQLGTSTESGSPTIPSTILSSADIGSAVGLAFFPAPATLPLYGRFE